MAALISDADRAAFHEVGAVAVRGFVDPAWTTELAAAADALRAEIGDQGSGGCFGTNVWRRSDAVRRFMHSSGVAEAGADLLGSEEVRLYEDLFIYKDAGVGSATAWHQDDPQWPLEGSQMCSFWLSTEATTPATGALRLVAGSHRGPAYTPTMPPGREQFAEEFEGGAFPDVDADPERFPVVSFDTEPGDVVVFHPRMVHGAAGPSATRPRRTFSFRLVGDDVHWHHRDCVFLDFLRELPIPDGDPLPEEHFPLLWAAPRPEASVRG